MDWLIEFYLFSGFFFQVKCVSGILLHFARCANLIKSLINVKFFFVFEGTYTPIKTRETEVQNSIDILVAQRPSTVRSPQKIHHCTR